MNVMLMRRWLATLCLFVVLAAALAVAMLPWLRPDKYGIIALLALIAAAFLGGRGLWRRPPRAFVAVCLAVLLLWPATVIARGFGRIDMLAILFHADFGMEGATLSGLESEILQGFISSALICLSVGWLTALWLLRTLSMVGAALGLLAINPMVQFAVLTVFQPSIESDLAERLVTPDIVPAREKPDLILIYLEGLDRQFADPDVWGDLYAPLSSLAAEGTSFTAVHQVAGTGWSLAGMVATQCGVPVVPRGLIYRNNFDDLKTFMPKITCLGDVLAAQGYRSAYVVGGDLGFGGIGTFYKTHRIDDRTGLEEHKAIYPAEQIAAALIGWVLDDEMVFQTARQKQAELAAQAAPYALIVETIGPHGRAGYLSRRCNDDGKGAKSDDVRRVIACTLADLAAFVRDARASQAAARPGRELHFVIMSDHLSHNGRTPPVAAEYDRVNTVIFIGGGATPGREIAKPGSMIDVFPTLLDWLGFARRPVAAGLGRSLLGTQPTLLKEVGPGLLDRMLVGDGALSRNIWRESAP
jgi:phosphoglycerol transferase